jgi:glutathione synthase/RimK-type ligase-like ATP-grasp enzyme
MMIGKTIKILPYKMGSASARELSKALGVKRIKHQGKPIFIKGTLINWGSSSYPDRVLYNPGARVLNSSENIARAANKLEAFKILEGHVPTPLFTESRQEALEWLTEGIVVCRTVLNGHSGKGIVLASALEELVPAPLYTKYVKKDQEYRLHVFKGECFFVQRKARKLEVPDDKVDWQVRNHQNGFIYANKNVEVPELFKEIAVKAIITLGLDFGAVDLIATKKVEPYVLEVNTAPGLTGTTLEKYCEQFRRIL